MITLKLFNHRVDIEKTKIGYYNYHCYLYHDNYLYHYRYKDNLLSALLFLIGYDTK